MSNNENLPPPPMLVRQVAGDVHEPQLVDTSPQPTFIVNGQLDDIMRNNGWWVPEGEYEEEDVTDDSDDSDEEEDEEEINEIVNNF
jgi:hypothetical protein